MRTEDDLGFATGLAETMLHAVLVRLGFAVEFHPDIPGTANRVDFLIRRADGERLAYLEITTMNPPAAKVARDRREAVVFEAINGAALPEDIRLGYGVLSYGKASPSAAKIRFAVERWAVENADAARGDRDRDVRTVIVVDDWRFQLSLMSGFKPRHSGSRIALYGTMNGRVLGVVPSTEGLAKALDTKATKYGDLDLPYVIAVFDRTDSLAWFSQRFHRRVAEVLFGSEVVDTFGLFPKRG